MVSPIAKITLSLLALCGLIGCTAKSSQRELIIYTWSEYFQDDVIREFEHEYKVRVRADYFSSNEQLLAKMQLSARSSGRGPDLILPSDYMVKTMVGLKLIKPLDHSALQFLGEFEPEFLKAPYDPGLVYTIPMAIGTSGLAVNTKLAPKMDLDAITWRELLENPRYKDRVTLLDDPREVLNIALMIQGKRWSEASADDIHAAFNYLKAHRQNLRAFTAETRPVIEADECWFCQTYSGDAMNVAKSKPEIKYVIPREGAAIWADNFAIPTKGREDALAYAFMNKMLSAAGAKRFTENIFYRTANGHARERMSPEFKENLMIFPAEKDRARLVYLEVPLHLTLVIDKEWTEFKSR